MLTTFLRFGFILIYLVVVSQGIFYWFAVSKAFSTISIDAFAEQRKAVDLVIGGRLKIAYLLSLIFGISILISSIKTPGSLVFITTAIAMLCLVADLAIAIKGNVPINAHFNAYIPGDMSLDWNGLRLKWLSIIEYRGLITMAGMLALLLGMFLKDKMGGLIAE